MRYLGIDYGTKRIGLALSDEGGKIAFPNSVVAAGPTALSEITSLVAKESVGKIIIGESRNFVGEPNLVQEDILQFKKDLEELTKLPIEFVQEFFTSTEAARQFAPDVSPVGSGLRPRGSRKANPEHKNLDASAAALLLQSYLDTH